MHRSYSHISKIFKLLKIIKRSVYQGFIMLSIIALSFPACKKDKTADSEDITSVEENAQADEIFSDIFTDVGTVETEYPAKFNSSETKIESVKSGNPSVSNSCADVTVTSQGGGWPKTVTFDFGNGCKENDRTRKGKVIAVFSASFKNTGSVITVTFDNYYVNDNKIEGTKTITNKGNATGNYKFTVDVSKSKINNINGGTRTWTSNRTIEWIKGIDNDPSDDKFSITGSASGTNSKGKDFNVTIIKPLIKAIGCRFITQGTLQVTATGRPAIALDYGNGDCDDKATVSVGGISREITLRK
jgi:hypothetical protein